MRKFIVLLCSFLIIRLTKQSQIPYQVLNQTMSDPSLQFYGLAGDTINITVEFNVGVNFTFALFKINNTDNFLSRELIYGRNDLTNIILIETTMQFNESALYLVFIEIIDSRQFIISMKMQAEINSLVIIQIYETVIRTYGSNLNNGAIYQFQTLSYCKIKIYWNGPNVTLKIYAPSQNIWYGIPEIQKLAQNGTYFDLNLTSTGKWNLVAINNYYSWNDTKRGIVNFTTFTQAKCVHSCSGNSYPVVGLAPGKTDQCICDFKIPNLVWNPIKKVCDLCSHGICVPIICNNGKRQQWQQCDNGGEIGCKNGCRPDLGFNCSGEIGSKSVCNGICGDGIKILNQECDNGGEIGCMSGCRPDLGFNCSGEIGSKSLCVASSSSPSIYLYIGIGCGILIVIIIFTILFCFFKKSKANSKLPDLNTVSLPNKELKNELKIIQINEIKNKVQGKQTTMDNIYELKQRKERQNNQAQRIINPYSQCCICLAGQCDLYLPCKHLFHRKCIFQWLKNEKECPLCRKDPLQSSRIGLSYLS